jgi:muramoyltetrapeptide carboxypeptidase
VEVETIKKNILPAKLQPGDKIGLAAPASPFDQEKFKKGLAVVEGAGFEILVPENIYRKNGYFAGNDQERAGVLNQLFEDPDVKAIVCARGGYGSIRVLDFLDYENIRRNPKIIIGFSDITALLVNLNKKCGLITFHGPVATSLEGLSEDARASFFSALTVRRSHILKAKEGRIIYHGSGNGVLTGGNLTTLCSLTGTPYAPYLKDVILFLEDRGEAPYRIDRMVKQMALAGCFDRVKGLVLGSFSDCGDFEQIQSVFEEQFQHSGIPVMTGFNIGHQADNLTIPIGSMAEMDTRSGTVSYFS